MRISVLHNRDSHLLEEDPGREAREDVVRVAAALQTALSTQKRTTVQRIELGSDVFALGQALKDQRPDVVVNLCESLAADSRGEMIAPALLEMTGVAYTGSDALSLGLALHKDKAKELLRARGVPTPDFAIVSSVAEVMSVSESLSFPLIVKPSREDASVGIDFESVVFDRPALGKAVARVLRTFRQSALVEHYVDGREIYVPMLGNKPRRSLPLTEIHYGKAFDNKPRILSYRAKWETQSPECLDSSSQPTTLSAAQQRKCVEVAFAAFEALGCRDYGRVDLRLTSDGSPQVIDINPNCDLHPQSGFAKAAGAAGIGYPDLAWHLVELALERRNGNTASTATGSAAARRVVGTHRDVHSARGGMRARAHRSRADANES